MWGRAKIGPLLLAETTLGGTSSTKPMTFRSMMVIEVLIAVGDGVELARTTPPSHMS